RRESVSSRGRGVVGGSEQRGSTAWRTTYRRPSGGQRLRHLERVQPRDVAVHQLPALLRGQAPQIALDDLFRSRPGRVLVRIVARPHYVVVVEIRERQGPDRVVEERCVDLAPIVVRRPHGERDRRLVAEPLVGAVHPPDQGGQPGVLVLYRYAP